MANGAESARAKDTEDKARLRAKATEFANEIRRLNLPHVKSAQPLSLLRWDRTDGWWVQIATWRGLGIGISIDQALRPHMHPAPQSRQFWYGFWHPHHKRILDLASSVPGRLRPRIVVDDLFQSDTQIKTKDLRFPVRETVSKQEGYFGIYEFERSLVPHINISDAAAFIKTSVLSFEEAKSDNWRGGASARSASDPYSRFPNARAEKVDPKHTRLQNKFEDHIKRLGATHVTSDRAGVDVQYRVDEKLVLAEVKPSNTRNEIRQAMGQLFDYEQDRGDADARLLIVLGHKPTQRDATLATSNRCGIAYPLDTGFKIKFA